MRILVTGSMNWTDAEAIRNVLSRYSEGTVIVTGDTPSVDALAIQIGRELGFRVEAMHKTNGDALRYPGEAWKGLNERMVNSGISLVLAFHPELGQPNRARGTQHVLDLASAMNIPIDHYR